MQLHSTLSFHIAPLIREFQSSLERKLVSWSDQALTLQQTDSWYPSCPTLSSSEHSPPGSAGLYETPVRYSLCVGKTDKYPYR